MVGSCSRGSRGPRPKTSSRISSMTRSLSTRLRGVFSSSTSLATAARISARTRSPAMEDSASRLIRSSSLRCSVNFNSWYSGVEPSRVKSRFTQPVSRLSPDLDPLSIMEAMVVCLLSEQCEAFLGVSRRFVLFEIRQLQGEPGNLLPQLGTAREHAALRVGFVLLGIVVGHGAKDRRSQHLFEFGRRDVQPLGGAVENQLDTVLAVTAVNQGLDDLLGLVQRGDFQGGDQAGFIDFFERRHPQVGEAASQIDQGPIVVRARKAEHLPDLLVLGLLLGGQESVGDEMLPSKVLDVKGYD